MKNLFYDLPGDVQGVIFKKVFKMEVLEQLQKIFNKIEYQATELKTADHGRGNYSFDYFRYSPRLYLKIKDLPQDCF